jgi:hypothetical protein
MSDKLSTKEIVESICADFKEEFIGHTSLVAEFLDIKPSEARKVLIESLKEES